MASLNFFLPRLSSPLRLNKLHVNRGLSLTYTVAVLSCIVLFFPTLLFMLLPVNSGP
jgi:hypothetical protein